jgi:MFS family permease
MMLVLASGFAVMVLEIVGVRFLAKDFGSSFYVWTSQIGVVLVALALGYFIGGALADRYGRLSPVSWLLLPAGALTCVIPEFAAPLIDMLIRRHPADAPVPVLWQKLDPALGSCLVFMLPCVALAAVSPCVIRLGACDLSRVGRFSGAVIAASTIGSVAGVFISGYVLIDMMRLSHIIRLTGGLTLLLGAACWLAGRGSDRAREVKPADSHVQ